MIPGYDISFYQTYSTDYGKWYFDAKVAIEKGMKFAFHRASIGGSSRMEIVKDYAVDWFAQNSKEAGIPRGFYHFAKPGQTSPQKQAEMFWRITKDYEAELPPVLDFEFALPVNGQWLGLSWCLAYMTTLEKLMMEQELDDEGIVFDTVDFELSNYKSNGEWTIKVSGREIQNQPDIKEIIDRHIPPILYTGSSFWAGVRDSENATWAKRFPLWVANYFSSLTFPQYNIPDKVINSTTLPAVPKPWNDYTFWQYCAAGDAEFYGGDYAKHTDKAGLDMNVFNGDENKFRELFRLDVIPEEPPEEPPDTDEYARIDCQFYWFRSAPIYADDSKEIVLPMGYEAKLTGNEVKEWDTGITWIEVMLDRCGDYVGWISKNNKYISIISR